MAKQSFLTGLKQLFLIVIGFICLEMPAEVKTNVLLFTADDLHRESLGCYGGPTGLTPSVDQFASEGVCFEHAFVASPLCVPSRATLLTGLYPHNSGVDVLKNVRPGTKTLITLLPREKCYTGVIGKVRHSSPATHKEWGFASWKFDENDRRNPGLYEKECRRFFQQAKEQKKPFFLMVNCHDPHRPFCNPKNRSTMRGYSSRLYLPGEVKVPGFLPDLPEVRQELSCYQNSVKRMDNTFGLVLKALKQAGLNSNTMVVFLSDNGIAMPFAKGNLYPAGVRTPLIVRWPGMVKAGTSDSRHWISSVDIMPTILNVFDMKIPAGLDGASFLPLLKGSKTYKAARRHIYCQTNWNAARQLLPMRSVQNERYCYIFNPWSNGKKRFEMGNSEMLAMYGMNAYGEHDPALKKRIQFYRHRSLQELYDLKQDPHCLHNIVADKNSIEVLQKMQNLLKGDMAQSGDPLLEAFLKMVKPPQL